MKRIDKIILNNEDIRTILKKYLKEEDMIVPEKFDIFINMGKDKWEKLSEYCKTEEKIKIEIEIDEIEKMFTESKENIVDEYEWNLIPE